MFAVVDANQTTDDFPFLTILIRPTEKVAAPISVAATFLRVHQFPSAAWLSREAASDGGRASKSRERSGRKKEKGHTEIGAALLSTSRQCAD
jgi:hypothetical protein